MATIEVDVNDVIGLNAAALRVLSDNLGDDAASAFLKQYEKPCIIRSDTGRKRPRLTVSQIADILDNAKAEAEVARLNASVTNHGDFTKDRHKLPKKTSAEVFAGIMRLQKERSRKKRLQKERV